MRSFLRERSFRAASRGHVRSRSRSDPGLAPEDALVQELKTRLGVGGPGAAELPAELPPVPIHARVLALIDPRVNRPRYGEPRALRASWPFVARLWGEVEQPARAHVDSKKRADCEHELDVADIFVGLVEPPPLVPAGIRPGRVFEIRPRIDERGAPRCEFRLYVVLES